MIPFFYASGHSNYAKSALLYYQQLQAFLKKLNPEEYERFVNQGFFTVRRSDNFWSGIWTDLCIEQDLMRMIKVVGGLIGRHFTESTIASFDFDNIYIVGNVQDR